MGARRSRLWVNACMPARHALTRAAGYTPHLQMELMLLTSVACCSEPKSMRAHRPSSCCAVKGRPL